jgi:hypothetical protein
MRDVVTTVIKRTDRRGRDLFGASYLSVWRTYYFLRRADVLLSSAQHAAIANAMAQDPRLASHN